MNKQKNILIIDQEREDRSRVVEILGKNGFTAFAAENGEQGLEYISDKRPELIFTALNLPGISGVEICRTVRKMDSLDRTQLIMLAAKGNEKGILEGFEVGADDFIFKPVKEEVLLGRVWYFFGKGQAQENSTDSGDLVLVDNICVNKAKHTVTVDDTAVDLTLSEFIIMTILLKKAGYVYSREQILQAIHGEDAEVTPRSVDVHITGLRKKLGTYGQYIEAVRGIGYRYQKQEAERTLQEENHAAYIHSI